MCGITGFIDLMHSTGNDELNAVVTEMANTIYHRGPDDGSTWVDEKDGVALGHRRLSIKDLSIEGRQPMVSAGKRFVLVFNGEIYNHRQLRNELESKGSGFRGYSDTEVMLTSIETWGIAVALGKFVGMFAFALWDRKEKLLYLGRDRLGEKPLYYGWMGNIFLFGSELKALRAHPHFRLEINHSVLPLYLRYNYIPTPYSIYKGINKLPQASYLVINPYDLSKRQEPIYYWSAEKIVELSITDPFSGTEDEAIKHLDKLLRESIRQQMEADVPLGAFLSGGVDSSMITALMQVQSNQQVNTFTIGYEEAEYNEAKQAKAVAEYLGTNHTEFYVTHQQALDVVPKIPTIYDEPFADASQIPTFIVSKLARQHVTVVLSGDGGDELFGGYNRHIWVEKIWNKVNRYPYRFRKLGAHLLKNLSSHGSKLNFLLPPKYKQRLPENKLIKLADILSEEHPEDMFHILLSRWKSPENLVLNFSESMPTIIAQTQLENITGITQKIMLVDMLNYLPDDILVKVDRASMGVSLESRSPFLDHRLVEFALHIPLSMKMKEEKSKWLLRQVLYQYVPEQLIDRPKMGFGVPIDKWLRNPLKEWAEELLSKKRLREDGFFNPEPIAEIWEEHLQGKKNWDHELWNILMFQAWLEKNG